MRWMLMLAVMFAGCAAPGPAVDGPGPDDEHPTVTCPETSTSGVPDGCTVGDCVAFLHLRIDYAGAGNEESSMVLARWSHRGLGIADLQDESDHQHIVATGEGRFNMTPEGGRQFDEWVDTLARPEHAVLAWFAATSDDAQAAFCDAWEGTPQGREGSWAFEAYGGYDGTPKYVDSDSPLALAFCDAWLETWDSADVPEPTGSHHGRFCRDD